MRLAPHLSARESSPASGRPHDRTVCIVAILRDEAWFVDEWLAYHRIIGADHFVLYDDDPSLSLRDFVAPHASYTTVVDWFGRGERLAGRNRQTKAYTDALSGIAGTFEWVAFIDGDEYIVLRKHADLHSFLADFGDVGAVSLQWHGFGHNGFYADPPGLVTSSLTRRRLEPGRLAKSITRVAAIKRVRSAHYCDLKRGFRWVDPNGRPFEDAVYPGKTDVAHINHYMARSFQRWMQKAERGDVAFNPAKLPAKDRWKTHEEGWLRSFIEVIAKDWNEHVDVYMVQYEPAILSHLRSIGIELAERHSA